MNGREWRLTHWLKLTLRGWRVGTDPRRPGGSCLISPRGTVYELKFHKGVYARQLKGGSDET